MKDQIKITLNRLKNPTVFLSIVSQVITVLVLLNVSVNAEILTGVAVSVCSILVALGIMSNPTTKNSGFGDDIKLCENCKINTEHYLVGDKLICRHCGSIAKDEELKTPEING